MRRIGENYDGEYFRVVVEEVDTDCRSQCNLDDLEDRSTDRWQHAPSYKARRGR